MEIGTPHPCVAGLLLREWTTRYRHGTAVTDDFTGLAANYAHESLRPLWDAWLYSAQVPAVDSPS